MEPPSAMMGTPAPSTPKTPKLLPQLFAEKQKENDVLRHKLRTERLSHNKMLAEKTTLLSVLKKELEFEQRKHVDDISGKEKEVKVLRGRIAELEGKWAKVDQERQGDLQRQLDARNEELQRLKKQLLLESERAFQLNIDLQKLQNGHLTLSTENNLVMDELRCLKEKEAQWALKEQARIEEAARLRESMAFLKRSTAEELGTMQQKLQEAQRGSMTGTTPEEDEALQDELATLRVAKVSLSCQLAGAEARIEELETLQRQEWNAEAELKSKTEELLAQLAAFKAEANRHADTVAELSAALAEKDRSSAQVLKNLEEEHGVRIARLQAEHECALEEAKMETQKRCQEEALRAEELQAISCDAQEAVHGLETQILELTAQLDAARVEVVTQSDRASVLEFSQSRRESSQNKARKSFQEEIAALQVREDGLAEKLRQEREAREDLSRKLATEAQKRSALEKELQLAQDRLSEGAVQMSSLQERNASGAEEVCKLQARLTEVEAHLEKSKTGRSSSDRFHAAALAELRAVHERLQRRAHELETECFGLHQQESAWQAKLDERCSQMAVLREELAFARRCNCNERPEARAPTQTRSTQCASSAAEESLTIEVVRKLKLQLQEVSDSRDRLEAMLTTRETAKQEELACSSSSSPICSKPISKKRKLSVLADVTNIKPACLEQNSAGPTSSAEAPVEKRQAYESMMALLQFTSTNAGRPPRELYRQPRVTRSGKCIG